MANPLTKLTFGLEHTETQSRRVMSNDARLSPAAPRLSPNELLESLPCVIYECNPSLVISYVSANVFELIGTHAVDLIGNRLLWDERIIQEDLQVISGKLLELEANGVASVIHRIIRRSGLPIWVCNNLRRITVGSDNVIHGCIVPLHNERRIHAVDPGVISRFVHKLGNQFQLLNLVINSLRKNLPDSRETEILQQAVEKSIELARAFSDFSQASTWMSIVDLAEILRAACASKRSIFLRKGISFEEQVSAEIGTTSVYGDPFLLELTVSNVLQNALEATDPGGTVIFSAEVESKPSRGCVTKLSITDSGCGIAEGNLENVLTPFFTLKKDHEGLGLSMAARFVELHGGILRVISTEGKGTEIEIILPVVFSARPPDF